MKNISNEVIKKIKDNNIKPKPRWYFITKNYFIWSIFGISIILGSFAFSMVLFIIKQLDWDIYHYMGDSFLKTVFISLPYLWLIFLILFTGVAYYSFIHTKRGYRFKSFQERPVLVNVAVLENNFATGEEITPKILLEKSLIRRKENKIPKVKILGNGDIKIKLNISGCSFSKSAKEKIEENGGKIG